LKNKKYSLFKINGLIGLMIRKKELMHFNKIFKKLLFKSLIFKNKINSSMELNPDPSPRALKTHKDLSKK
jgi:hypothetical protein